MIGHDSVCKLARPQNSGIVPTSVGPKASKLVIYIPGREIVSVHLGERLE
jgi:hypothetical protein